VLAQGEQAARTDVVLSPGAQLSMASVNNLATCWAWRSLGSLSAVVGAELGRAFGAVRVAGGVLDGALAAAAGAVVVVVLATLGPPAGPTGTDVVGGTVAVGAGRAPAFGAGGAAWLVGRP
jgi:zinc transporter ZupT